MTLQFRHVLLGAIACGLVLGLGLIALSPTAAQPLSDDQFVANTVIDCSTNPTYNDRFIASAFRAGGGHTGGSNRNCNACHKSDNPRMNTGDKPVLVMGNSILHNRMDEPVNYSVKYGRNGKWEDFELAANMTRNHGFDYERPRQNKSKEVFIKYKTSDEQTIERPLQLMATPNRKLGTVYFFDKDKGDRQVYLWVPGKQPARR